MDEDRVAAANVAKIADRYGMPLALLSELAKPIAPTLTTERLRLWLTRDTTAPMDVLEMSALASALGVDPSDLLAVAA